MSQGGRSGRQKLAVSVLPQVFVEKESNEGLRYRHSSCSSPEGQPFNTPLVTSTPMVSPQERQSRLENLRGQFKTPAKVKNSTIDMDSGYGGLNTTSYKKYDEPLNLEGSYISANKSSSLLDLLVSPVQQLRNRWRGRPSFLEPGQTKLGGVPGKIVRQVEPQQILAILVASVVFVSLGFVLLVTFGLNSPKVYKSELLDQEIDAERLQVSENLEDTQKIRLGGKKAAIQYVFDKLLEDGKLSQDVIDKQIQYLYDTVKEERSVIDIANFNVEEGGQILPNNPLIVGETLPDGSLEDEKAVLRSKLRSFKSNTATPQRKSGPNKRLFKVNEGEDILMPVLQVEGVELKSTSGETKSEVKESPKFDVAASKGDIMIDTSDVIKNRELPVGLIEAGVSVKPKKTKLQNPLLKPSLRKRMSKARRKTSNVSLEAFEEKLQETFDVSSEVPMSKLEEKDLDQDLEYKSLNDPVMDFPDDPKFRKRSRREAESTFGGGFRDAKSGDGGFRKLNVENASE